MTSGSQTICITRFRAKRREQVADQVAREEPLEIQIGRTPLSVTMRTPGYDFDLVTGFLFTEGIIQDGALPKLKPQERNVIQVEASHLQVAGTRRLRSRFFVSSSCGLCGRTTVADIRRKLGALKSDLTLPTKALSSLTFSLRKHQETFDVTGGLHAAALFDGTGKILVVREDVGRHNAVDKAIGYWIRNPKKIPRPFGLLVSGRASFEIIQKALAAKIPFVAAVSAPSSLAVELASETGITLVAFLRGSSFNVYTREDRITED